MAGAVKNDELGISWRNSLFYIFRRITPRSNFPPSFKIILYFYVTICDAFINTYFGRNGHFGIHYLYYRDTLQYIQIMYCAIGELLSIYVIPRTNECTRVYTFRGVEVLHYVLAVPSLLLLLHIILNVYWLYPFPCEVLVVLF